MLVKKQISYLKINVQFMFNQLLASETADSRHYGGCFSFARRRNNYYFC